METINAFSLTAREKQIISEIAVGLGYKEIATKAYISPETVKQHVKNIYRKMGVHNRMKASLLYMHSENILPQIAGTLV